MNRKYFVASGMMLLFLMIAPGARAEVKGAAPGRFRIEQELVLPATPNEVFDAVTGDISAWWDHSFSEHPKKLYIEARPGGGFYEIFDDAGNGAMHATVIYADRGKMLRYTGPLGLAAFSVDMVTTYTLSPDPGGTKFHLTVTATGEVDEALAKGVDGVWHHFLDERLKPYITSGEYKKHPRGLPAPGLKPVSARLPAGADGQALGSSTATVDGFACLAGHWRGVAGNDETEGVCLAPSRGMMMCMFRVMDAEKVVGLEYSTLWQGENGIEEHVRFFTQDLTETQGDDGIRLHLAKYSSTEMVFDNVKKDGAVKHVTIARQGENEFTTHVEVVTKEGQTSFIDAKWKRRD